MAIDAIEIDPVCGTEVDPDAVAGQSENGDRTFYFCSQACKEAFDDDPTEFME